jgi:hypothetical protein
MLGGALASAVLAFTGAALKRIWQAHQALRERVERNTLRIIRLETLVIGKDADPSADDG